MAINDQQYGYTYHNNWATPSNEGWYSNSVNYSEQQEKLDLIKEILEETFGIIVEREMTSAYRNYLDELLAILPEELHYLIEIIEMYQKGVQRYQMRFNYDYVQPEFKFTTATTTSSPTFAVSHTTAADEYITYNGSIITTTAGDL